LANLTDEQRETFLQRFKDRPGDFVGQEVVRLSTTPVLRDDRLEPAPFVLRVYATATPDGMKIMPGGFCRTSDRPDVRAISMGEDAGTADVWVIADGPVDRTTLLASKDDVKIRRITGHLPSRAADNLFWLGRYLERAEATLRLVRSICTSLMDSEAAVHTAGETLVKLEGLLVEWGALDEEHLGRTALEATREALLDQEAYGSVIYLIRAARRTADSMRERLSGDFWTLLVSLENRLVNRSDKLLSEADALQQIEAALQLLAALGGLTHENMNRSAGWRFLDMGRRIERGINTCRFARTLADEDATSDDLDLLLDLADSQITYRARYLATPSTAPVLDLLLLDPANPRSLAYQAQALVGHIEALPSLGTDNLPEAPLLEARAILAPLSSLPVSAWNLARLADVERRLLALSDTISTRYFLQFEKAEPVAKSSLLA